LTEGDVLEPARPNRSSWYSRPLIRVNRCCLAVMGSALLVSNGRCCSPPRLEWLGASERRIFVRGRGAQCEVQSAERGVLVQHLIAGTAQGRFRRRDWDRAAGCSCRTSRRRRLPTSPEVGATEGVNPRGRRPRADRRPVDQAIFITKRGNRCSVFRIRRRRRACPP